MNMLLSKTKAMTLLLFLPLLFLSTDLLAQSPASSSVSVVDKINQSNENLPGERLYLHFDKPCYTIGDTVWFKGYLVDPTLAYSPLSSRIYVDLISDSNKVIQHFIFPVSLGLAVGHIYLDEKLLYEGAYTIRAYTNWMRNFGADQFFYRNFYVAGSGNNTLLIHSKSSFAANQVKVDLRFSGMEQEPIGIRKLQLTLADDKKTFNRGNAQTLNDGSLNLNFELPGNIAVKNLTLVTQDKKDNSIEKIPLHLNRPADVDVQFMPESGQMVELLPAHIGFKSVGEDGKGVAIKGILTDRENNDQVDFESVHDGMGVFDFVPQPGESYTARITLPDGGIKTVNIPGIKKSGTVLKVNNTLPDSLEISIFSTRDVQSAIHDYTLLGQSRGLVYYAATFKLNQDIINFRVPKSLFPTGVAHLTLFNAKNEPLNERLSFINHNDNLKVEINAGSALYAPRDSIPLHITVKDIKGNPVVGSFSLEVTDDGQIKKTGTDNVNIFTQLLLASDLKGYVEDPAWYFTPNRDAAKALDILLLTQGWIGYNWKTLLNGPAQPAFTAEAQYTISGRINNLLNKPMSNSKVFLVSTGKIRLYKDALTNTAGQFLFKNFPPITDSITFVLEARNAKGRIINAGISVDENKAPPAVALPYFPVPVPWYINTDSTVLNYVKKSSAYHDAIADLQNGPGSHLLKTVNIKGKAIIKDSKNLNGLGNYDQAITQNDIEKAGKISLLKLIEQKANGFHDGYGPKGKGLAFMLKDKKVHFSIDGIDIDRFYEKSDNPVPDEHYNYQKDILEYFTAEDITGMEVLYNPQYTALYEDKNLPALYDDQNLPTKPISGSTSDLAAYIEITTRSGQGPYANSPKGIYVYRPAPITIPAQFYTPRYPVKNRYPGFTDQRSTIHWEPNIVTNKNGQANTFFYASDPLTTYTIILQGADLNGNVGYTTQAITITNKK
jgi:hypothetical protein